VHNEVRHDLLISDARQIAGTLTRDLIWPIVALNIPGIDIRRAPRFRFLTDEAEDLKARADRDKVLFDMGYRLTPEKVEEVYGEGYVPVETKGSESSASTPTPEEPGQAAATAGHHCPHCAQAALSADNEPDTVDQMVDRLSADAQPSIDAMLDTIKTVLDQADSLEDFQDKLLAAYPTLDDEALAEVMALGLSAAELAGRFEVQEEQS